MKNTILIFLLIVISHPVFSQTKSPQLNRDLKELRKGFDAKDYDIVAKYTYPKVVEMMGGKENLKRAFKAEIVGMEEDGFYFVKVTFKKPSTFLKNENELQCSFTQVIIMQTPKGKVEAEYTMIAISKNNGKNWTFMDTSGKTKETMRSYFPNLHPDIVILPKKQKFLK